MSDSPTYEDLVRRKREAQERKQRAIESMSDEDWAEAQRNLDKAKAEGRMPPRITSRRPLK